MIAMQKKRRIVADSGADITTLAGADFSVAPLKIITSEREYVDDDTLDVAQMANEMLTYKGRSTTSCPNTEDWLKAFGDGEEIFCVTITATLSGSYNSAMIAKREYEEKYPDRRVFVLNSLSTGPESVLMLKKLVELCDRGLEFDDICREIEKYSLTTQLIFVLESLKNLANNGRVSPIVAKMAGILGIRLVAKASDRGDVEPIAKCRGERRALEEVIERMKSMGFAGGRVEIGHCLNENAAKQLEAMIKEAYPTAELEVYHLGGLCSFYAEKGGVLVGFETCGE